MYKNVILILSMILFVGCAMLAPYEPPTKGPVATLILPVRATSYSLGFNGSNAWFAIADETGCGDFYIPKEGLKGQKTAEYKIPANKDIFINFGAYLGNSTCNIVRVINNVEEGKVYEVRGAVIKDYCTLSVIEKSGTKEIPVKMGMAYIDPGLGKQKACKDKNGFNAIK